MQHLRWDSNCELFFASKRLLACMSREAAAQVNAQCNPLLLPFVVCDFDKGLRDMHRCGRLHPASSLICWHHFKFDTVAGICMTSPLKRWAAFGRRGPP